MQLKKLLTTVQTFNLPKKLYSSSTYLFEDQHIFSQEKKPRARDHMVRTEKSPRQKALCPAQVIRYHDLSKTVKGLTLFIDENERKNAAFKAGQWIDMFIPDIETVGGFSICNSPNGLQKNGELDLAVKFSDHPPALWIHQQCSIGNRVSIRIGGNFYYDDTPDHDLLLIAGGVGINPLMSIFRHQRDVQVEKSIQTPSSNKKIVLVYSAKTYEELIFQEKIKGICKATHASCHFHVTKETNDGHWPDVMPYWSYENSKITRDSLAASTSSLPVDSTDCYICGPPPFIEKIEEHLLKLRYPKRHIFYEKWW